MDEPETLFEYRRRRLREIADSVGYDRDKALRMYHEDTKQRMLEPVQRRIFEWIYPKCPECRRPITHKHGCKLSGRINMKPRRRR